MKVILAWAIILTLQVSVQGEDCQSVSDCTLTTCGTGGTLACAWDKCTCVISCTPDEDLGWCFMARNCWDAQGAGNFDCNCGPTDLHCIDNHCHCGYPPSKK